LDSSSTGGIIVNGIVQNIFSDRNYGFIVAEEGRFFFHSSACPQTFGRLRPGTRVSFTPTEAEKGPRAEDVRLQN
jgi:cold shock CspA family protein